MNTWNGLGRLTKDVELRYSQTGTANASFTLAVDNPFKKSHSGEREADFIRCVAFGKTAEIIAEYVKKGQQLAVEGRIQTGSYENKQGQRVFTTDVIVNQFTFVSGQQNNNQGNSNQAQGNQQQNQGNPFQGQGNQVDIPGDDLPF